MSLPKLATGTVINDHYRINDFIGEGGFAYVYSAYDENLRRKVAIKVLKAIDITDIDRYKREAQILAQVKHPNIVSIYSMDFLDENTPFIVMEYLEGEPLSRLIQNGESLSENLAKSILMQTLKALSYLHASGIIHRDLSPSNIFLVKETDGVRVRVIDFGLAKLLAADVQKLTKTGALVGNYRYMCPQQILSLASVDASWDIYAFGYIMMELLTGYPVFETDTPLSLLYHHQNTFPPEPKFRLTSCSNEELYKAIILRCIQKDTHDRFSRCEDVMSAFEGDLTTEEIIPRNGSNWNQKPSFKSGSSAASGIISWAALIAIPLLIMFLQFKVMPKKNHTNLDKTSNVSHKIPKIEALQRILSMKERRYGCDSPFVIASVEDLAQAYDDAKQFSTAEQLRLRALALRDKYRKTFPNFDKLNLSPDEGLLLSLASNYRFQGKPLQAIKVLNKVILMTDKTDKGKQQLLLAALQSVADIELKASNFKEAIPYFQRSIAIQIEKGSDYRGAIKYFGGSLGKNFAENEARTGYCSNLSSTYENLALCQIQCQDFPAALDSYRQALKVTDADKAEFSRLREDLTKKISDLEKTMALNHH